MSAKRVPLARRPACRARHAVPGASRARRAAGFTLIELLVAIAILAVVAILSWRGLDQIVRGRDIVTRSMAEERVFAQMFDQMRIDARQAVSDDEAGAPAVSVDGGALQIVRAFAVPPGAPPRLQVVRYRVSNGQVVRYASPPLANLGELRRALRGGESSTWSALPMMQGVGAIDARLYVPKEGWTSNMDAVRQQIAASADSVKVPQLGNAPVPRAVTGLEVSVGASSLARPVTRVFLVGE
ncbi:type II secretion system protein J [Paraburkholderia silviterrae]|uniref:Prepilin-type N-terminal cleavage/methylation domain-containing protein n=1 Tax=Paraburkholderia silviterrae TaxID=2528715 RepID=A0A4R5MB44_9BURK|nr:prepilin-type N-terminal cleavage/methylation domain-containing protein [Paraburkholderia silviterrae]TDG24012.1 prepilin-type N-terminal cleavage/methylation domain-containing protein [Paraburkholderia silviterrae]